MTFIFLPAEGESLSKRLVRFAHEAMADGPCSSGTDRARCKAIVSGGIADPHIESLVDLYSSCGVVVRGALGWAGYPIRQSWQAGQPLIGGWVPLSMGMLDHMGPGLEVEAGSVFLIHGGTNNWHVGFFIEGGRAGDTLATLEGGGGHSGTLCHLSTRSVVLWQHGRRMLGIWPPSKMPHARELSP